MQDDKVDAFLVRGIDHVNDDPDEDHAQCNTESRILLIAAVAAAALTHLFTLEKPVFIF